MTKQVSMKVPQIRARGFTDAWQEKPIGKILSEAIRPIVLEDNQQYELITVKRRNEGVVSRGHLLGKNILVKNYYQLEEGDFVISKRQVVHGATGIVPAELGNAIVSNEYLVAVGNSEVSSEFLTIISSLPDMKRKFFLSSYGVDIEKLFFDADDWKKRTVTIPTLSEQQKITAFFCELNRLIILHQCKHDKLLALKKAMLQKMFPQYGATVPEIRFKGFEEQWEERKLESLGEFNPNSTLPDVFNYVDLESVVGTQMVASRKVRKEDAPSRAQRLAREGDLFFQTVRPYQKNNHLFSLNKNDYVFSTGYAQIRPYNDGYFLLASVQLDGFIKLVMNNCTGTSYPAINSYVLSQLPVYAPSSPEEQEKIGNYFHKLDGLINQHTTQLVKLKQIKAACLEKMFFKPCGDEIKQGKNDDDLCQRS